MLVLFCLLDTHYVLSNMNLETHFFYFIDFIVFFLHFDGNLTQCLQQISEM